jgi:hypothetical protein
MIFFDYLEIDFQRMRLICPTVRTTRFLEVFDEVILECAKRWKNDWVHVFLPLLLLFLFEIKK